MMICARCSKTLRSSSVHRIIRTKAGNFRAAGLCPPCANSHDVEQKRHEFWRTALGVTAMAALFAGASYILLHYL
jgi:hypothetical protein